MTSTAWQPTLETEAKLLRGLGDPTRLALLQELRRGPLTAGQLSRLCELPAPKASNHLGCLLECGLVTIEPRGRYNVYALAHPAIGRLLDAAATVLAEVAPLIEACANYGPPSRRALRSPSVAIDLVDVDEARRGGPDQQASSQGGETP